MINKKKEAPFEDELEIREYYGRNTFGDHSALRPGELLQCVDYEIYWDQLKSRRGTQFNSDSANRAPAEAIINRASWDTGTSEFIIIQVLDQLFAHNTTTPDGYDLITLKTGGGFTLGDATRAELVVTGDRLYVFHPEGNFIVEWSGSVFEARQMGIPSPKILSVDNTTTVGQISGRYTYGVELAYYDSNNAEITGSSPWRFKFGSQEIATVDANVDGTGAIKIDLTIDSGTLNSDTLWTHFKLWRSFNQGVNTTGLQADDTLIIDDQGDVDTLYLVAVISKAEMLTNVGAITGPSEANKGLIPPGNTNVTAGLSVGVYHVIDNNLDIDLDIRQVRSSKLGTLDREPIPGGAYGAIHNKRIWVSGLKVDSTFTNSGDPIQDKSQNNVYYSPFDTNIYYELTGPLNLIDTSRDGQRTKKLISFEKDLFILKEAMTIRQPYGDLSYPIENLDQQIGIDDPNLAEFIPELGICAITNNYKEFMILGYDQIWRSTIGDIEISHSNRASTESYDASKVFMVFANAKLFISKGGGSFDVLNVGEKRGWSEFRYPMADLDPVLFNFENGKKIGAIAPQQYMMELEVKGKDDDVSWVDETDNNVFCPFHITHRFQFKDGAWIITHHWLGIMSTVVENITGVPYINGESWPTIGVDTVTQFTPDTNGIPVANLKDKEFRLYVEPATIGNFNWCFMAGNYIHYKITSQAPCTMKVHRFRGLFDEPGFYFDPFQNLTTNGFPSWFKTTPTINETGTAGDTITETGTAPDTITEGEA